jgi:hypothetical protein
MVWIGEERQAGEESAPEDAIQRGATMAAPGDSGYGEFRRVISASLAEKAGQMNGLNQVISFDSCRFNPGNLSDDYVRLGGVI